MIGQQIIGFAVIKMVGFNEYELIEDIRSNCKVICLNKEKDALYIKIYSYNIQKALSISQKHGFVAEVVHETGIYFILRRFIKRYGLYIGTLLSVILIMYFSNIAMRIEITGTNNEAVKAEILDILKQEGVSTGKYIPSMNFVKANIRLSSLCDDIAWSSIAHTGSVIKVEVTEITPKDDNESRRIPSNIIAKRDGVIVKAEVLAGQLEVLLGDAVAKGDMLVNGVIERRNGVTYYYHSLGKIMAEYDETVQIVKNYKATSKNYGKTHYVHALRIFEADFQLPGLKSKAGNFDVETDTAYLYFFGIKLPIGITTQKLTELSYDEEILSTEDAFFEAYRLLDNYEKNILSDEEIVSRNIEEVMTENGVTLFVNYKLIGEIGVQQEIFAK